MKKISFIFSLFLLLAIGCEEETLHPLNDSGGSPDPVSNIMVENIPGGAWISYTLPKDPNLLYVKAEVERNGELVESKASYFKEKLLVEGLGDTSPKEVKLYTVNRSEKISEPVSITITPLTPPIEEVLNSLDVKESWGGMNVDFESKASTQNRIVNIVIEVYVWNSDLKEWTDLDAYYTGLSSGSFSVRGLEPVERKFGFAVRDTWGNKSEIIEKVLTPIYEEELDGSKIKDIRGDYPVPQVGALPPSGDPMTELVDYSSSWRWNELFDGERGNNGWHTKEKMDQPAWIPFDLGEKVRLSRYKIWQRMHDNNSTYFYSHGNPHEWEIYGTNTPEDPSSWAKLDHEIMVKPSGLPLGQVNNDDVETARAGHEYEFPLEIPAVRYIAYKHIDAWASIEGATGFVHMSEMKIWGQVIQ